MACTFEEMPDPLAADVVPDELAWAELTAKAAAFSGDFFVVDEALEVELPVDVEVLEVEGLDVDVFEAELLEEDALEEPINPVVPALA